MNLQNWVKVFFSVYTCVENLTGSIDKVVELKSVNSMYSNMLTMEKNSTIRVFNTITKLINKKIVLLNIKILTENMLAHMPKNFARVMILKYIEEKNQSEICEIIDKQPRTYFRLAQLAVESGEKYLRAHGYDCEKIFEMCRSEKWLIDYVTEERKFSKKRVQTLENERRLILKLANREYVSMNF